MELLSLLGILIGITFFIVCCFKGVQIFLSAWLASVIIILFSGYFNWRVGRFGRRFYR